MAPNSDFKDAQDYVKRYGGLKRGTKQAKSALDDGDSSHAKLFRMHSDELAKAKAVIAGKSAGASKSSPKIKSAREALFGEGNFHETMTRSASWATDKLTHKDIVKLQDVKSKPTLKQALEINKGYRRLVTEINPKGMGKGYDADFEKDAHKEMHTKVVQAWKGAQALKAAGITKPKDVKNFVKSNGAKVPDTQKSDAQSKTAKVSKGGNRSIGGKSISKIAQSMKDSGKSGWVTIGGAKINLG